MTAEPPAGVEWGSFGALGAERTVIVLRSGATAMLDPDPEATTARTVRVAVVGLSSEDIDDPAAFGGETRAERTAVTLAGQVRAEAGESPVGLVGVGNTGDVALRLAAELGSGVDRLALIAVPAPETPLDRDDAEPVLARVTAKTLIMNGQHDPDAAAAAARWHRDRIAGSRVEMVPAAEQSAGDGRLALTDVWDRVLSHVAPGTKRT